MSEPDAVVTTTTTVDATHPADDHDGILSEPERKAATPLWYMLIATLCIVILGMAGTFVYLAVMGAIDSAAMVGLFGLVLAAVMDLYRQRKG
jgi:hypothetical protein